MTVLLDRASLEQRRLLARGSLAPLADSLRADLRPLLERTEVWIPPEKARMTRAGGRCPVHGIPLDFDPWSPHEHRCPRCDASYRDDAHYRWWIMSYQLWLAERAVHGAALHALRDDAAAGALARRILEGYCERYLAYPNADNVLGPTRPFFSTYLESIWLLQIAVALDLLELRGAAGSLGGRVRERIVAPSAALIADFDEGMSNRQVWNNAALAAAGALLGERRLVERAIEGPSGLLAHAGAALFADGSWYEGENYHLFAHRGLWHVATIAEAQGATLPAEPRRRISEGFVVPFATALPDFTSPSRRDSQYRVSLRQWRIAESCELGLARRDDGRLRAAMAELYRDDVAPGESGRATSAAEAERNFPSVRLTRASLGWKSLLFAREALPALASRVPTSVHLEGQGLAVLRREHARVYAALDYGASGGGHGHPDRLNLWLVVGDSRLLEDVGTGSYVDSSLHWYRSTLAHNAPLVDGKSQRRVDGELLAWDERGGAGWVAAAAQIAAGVRVERSVVVMSGYLLDEVRWTAGHDVTFDLPWHVDATPELPGDWTGAALSGGDGLEDGFPFVATAERKKGVAPASLVVRGAAGRDVRAWVTVDVPHEWWRCLAPGPPGAEPRHFLVVRARARAGCVRSVWAWSDSVESARFDGATTVVRAGTSESHEHRHAGARWQIDLHAGTARSSIVLEPNVGQRDEFPGSAHAAPFPAASARARAPRAPLALPRLRRLPEAIGVLLEGGSDGVVPCRFVLGAQHYRRSEEPWARAGAPEAEVVMAATDDALVLEVLVRKESPHFVPRRHENPLDNEHPDINSDGVQLYLGSPGLEGWSTAWLLVPEEGSDRVRVTVRSASGAPVPLDARWRRAPDGYIVRCVVPRAALGTARSSDVTLALVVNEQIPSRERRRGQLVLGGAGGGWVYLRGDREDPATALPFHIDDD